MSDLTDRGYPSARSYKPNRSDKRNALMTDSIGNGYYAGTADMGGGFKQSNADIALERLVNAYNNKAFGNPNAPLIQKYGNDYVDDNYDSRAYMSGLNLNDRNENRLGYIGKDARVDGTTYSLGIDNLSPILGDNNFDKSINLPIGSLGVDYDGDTFSASYESPSYNPYLFALKSLLNRGSL